MSDKVTILPTAARRPVKNPGPAVESKGNVEILPLVTRCAIPAERVLVEAQKEGLLDVVVVGWDANAGFYFKSSQSGGPEALWLLELARKRLLEVGDPT